MNKFRPMIGDGATVRIGTDSLAHTVIAVEGDEIVIQRDRADLANGIGSLVDDAMKVGPDALGNKYRGKQRWDYFRNQAGETARYARRQDGEWHEVEGPTWRRGLLAGRHEYVDFNF